MMRERNSRGTTCLEWRRDVSTRETFSKHVSTLSSCSSVQSYITVPRFSYNAHETALITLRESGHDVVVLFVEIGNNGTRFSQLWRFCVRLPCPARPEVHGAAATAAHYRLVTWFAANRIKTTRKDPIIATRLHARVRCVVSFYLRNTRMNAYRASIE